MQLRAAKIIDPPQRHEQSGAWSVPVRNLSTHIGPFPSESAALAFIDRHFPAVPLTAPKAVA